MNLAVVIVSEQTIPNVVYLKETKDNRDKVLFVTTSDMEKREKSRIIADAVGDCEFDKLIVDKDMIFDVGSKLEKYFSSNRYDKVFVNITGGTKIMSLATYTFFKDKFFTENIIYLPIGDAFYKQLYPLGDDGKAVNVPIEYKMNVEEYIKALGLKIKSIDKPLDIDLSKKLFNLFFENEWIFNELTDILRVYRNSKGPKKLSASNDYNKILGFLKLLGLNANKFDFFKNRDWIDYFSGGWFEEYMYSEIKRLNGVCVDDVIINLKLERKNLDAKTPNEFDVIFINNNMLNIVECKAGDLTGQQLTGTFYKVAYLNRVFGLSATSYMALLGQNIFEKNGKLKEDVSSKSKVFGVKLITREHIKEIDKIFRCK